MNKKIPLWILLLVIWLSLVGVIAFGWNVWRVTTSRQGAQSATDRLVVSIAAYPTFFVRSLNELKQPNKLISIDFFPALRNFKTEKDYVDSGYLLLATYSKVKDQSIARLVRLSDQKPLYEWTPDYAKIIDIAGGEKKYGRVPDKRSLPLYHPLLLNDGSIIFNTLQSPLIKIDKDSKLVWVVDGIFHHTVETDPEGNIWAPSIIKPSRFLSQILYEFKDDALTEVTPRGKIIFQRSVALILMDNGYRTLLLGSGTYEKDMLHLNSVQPALYTTQYWEKGDLLVSLRNKSTVFLYRPSTNKILWLRSGPWLNQHDARFVDSSRISVFGNDIIRIYGQEKLLASNNEEYIYNFKTDRIDTPYARLFHKAGIATTTEGVAMVQNNGDLMIEETNLNRILRLSRDNVRWEFVERVDDHSLAAFSCSEFISRQDFEKLTFLKK